MIELHFKKRGKVNSSYKIGIVSAYTDIKELNDPYFLSIRMAIEKRCYEEKIDFLSIYLSNLLCEEADNYKNLDGIIAIGIFQESEIERLSKLSSNIVFVDWSPEDYIYDSVKCDLKKGVKDALNHLENLGHKDIGYIGAKVTFDNGKTEEVELHNEREESYIEWMSKRGKLKEEWILKGRFNSEDGYRLMKEFLSMKKPPSAYFIASDPMAIGAYKAIFEEGYYVPEDISIVGFDDIPTASFLVPSLTTVKVFTDYMGDTAFETLIEKIKSGRSFGKKILLPVKLIVRESTGNRQ